MDSKREDLLKRLLATFKVEAAEHLHAINSGLLELGKASAPEKREELVEIVFREIHSLKGAARTVNLTEIESICQSIESIFSALKRKKIVFSPPLFDILNLAIDTIEKRLSYEEKPTSEAAPPITEILRRLEAIRKEGQSPAPLAESERKPSGMRSLPTSESEPEEAPSEFKPALMETVRISTARLNSLLLQAEEFILAKLKAAQQVAELRDIYNRLNTWKKEWAKVHSVLPTLQRLWIKNGNPNPPGKKEFTQLQAIIAGNDDCLKVLESQMASLALAAEQDRRSLTRMVDDLLVDMKQALMFPCQSLLELFPKLVRELSRDRGKEVELIIHGSEIKIDRRILEEIKDPLIHLVRNCLDHGIETPEVRAQKKKPLQGTVTIAISQNSSNQIEILVADDGAGIDTAKVKAIASKLGMLTVEEAERLSQPETLSFIFHSGVSTSPVITDISGRGLGLAIVQEKVEKLGGAVSVESQNDVGTRFRMVLPLTLITFRGITVRVNESLFVLPAAYVERVGRISPEAIKTVENRETVEWNEQAVSLVRLTDVLNLPRKSSSKDSSEKMPLLVLSSGSIRKRVAFLVDEILNEQEVSVKRLGPQLSRVRNIAGVTVLGSGKVVPILDVSDLMKSAVRTTVQAVPTTAPIEKEPAKKKSALVVEDSITARTLLKNILEGSGYEVKTAVDGVDAFTQLRTGDFDIVISDVDMPRMNGFELTTKIRNDKRLAEIPVVLVTALQSREDRERGIDVGANAYIVKSSFDQSNLLEVVRRLV